MTSERTDSKPWLVPAHDLLLRAALRPADKAIVAWDEWSEKYGKDHLDGPAGQLLPQVYRNLRRQLSESTWSQMLKGAYLRSWYKNAFLLDDLRALLAEFESRRLPLLIMGGAPSAALYYRDRGARSLRDCVLILRPQHLSDAARLLAQLGHRVELQERGERVFGRGAAYFRVGGLHVALCSRPWRRLPAKGEQQLWQHPVPVGLGRAMAVTVSVSGHLLYIGGRDQAAELRWLADIAMILRSSAHEVNWNWVAGTARAAGLHGTLRAALSYLESECEVAVSSAARAALSDGATAPDSRSTLWPSRSPLPPVLSRSRELRNWAAGLCRRRRRRAGPATRFVIITSGRSGSNLLVGLLRQHPNIDIAYEVFRRLRPDPVRGRTFRYGDSPDAFLAHIFDGRYEDHVRAVGFKLLYGHCHTEETRTVWDCLAEDSDLRVIHLLRQNRFESLVSLEVARRTDVWYVPASNPGQARDLLPFHLSPVQCAGYFVQLERQEQWMREKFGRQRLLTVQYADLVQNQSAVLRAVFEFLDISPSIRPPVMPSLKQARRSSEQQVANYRELKEFFRQTKYGHYFCSSEFREARVPFTAPE